MRKTAICLFMWLYLFTIPAYGDNAAEYFKLGLESAMTCKKNRILY